MLGFTHSNKSADPEATKTLLFLVACTVAGLLLSLASGGGALRDVVLKVAGAALLVLGSYYAARTLKESRADKRTDQILKATELTANSSPACAVALRTSFWSSLIGRSPARRRQRIST